MSYQVLARKWRPGNFREMVGQEHVLKALINALDYNRLHHAYLFTGTRGVGKTTIARILAKCLNCEAGVTSTPCGECSACTEIAEGRFVDLIEVDAASRTKVEDTRELLDNVQYAPARGRYKIYLIDEVHMLSNHSFNALLKTLEEPPDHVKFLLATTDPQKLPITILSRCLQFNLKNMSPERIVGHLQQIMQKEAVPFEESALWLLARGADGSMRDALSLTDQAIAYGSGQIVEPDVAAMLGTIDHQLIQNLMSGLIESDGKQLLDAVAKFAEHAPDFNAALSDLLTLLHRIAIAQALPEALDNSFGDRQQILVFAGQLPAEDVQLFYQTALIGRRDLYLAPDPRSGFEMTLLRMLAFKPQGVVDVPSKPLVSHSAVDNTVVSEQVVGETPPKKSQTEIAERPSAPAVSVVPEHNTNSSPSSLAPTEEVGVAAPTQPVADALNRVLGSTPVKPDKHDVTQALKDQIKAITGKEGITSNAKKTEAEIKKTPDEHAQSVDAEQKLSLESLSPVSWVSLYRQLNVRGILQSTASNSVYLGCEGAQLFFALDETKASLFDSSHSQRLADHLSDYFGRPVKVEINLQLLPEGVETPAQAAERECHERYQAALHTLAEDPVVQTLEREFNAVLDKESVSFDDKR